MTGIAISNHGNGRGYLSRIAGPNRGDFPVEVSSPIKYMYMVWHSLSRVDTLLPFEFLGGGHDLFPSRQQHLINFILHAHVLL